MNIVKLLNFALPSYIYIRAPAFRDTDAAIRLLQRAADGPDRGGRAHAYNRLARLYEAGVPGHLQRDRKTAARYYADAAAEGSNPSKDLFVSPESVSGRLCLVA